MTKQTISAQLAAFSVGLDYEDIPRAIAEKAKRHILDTFGAGVAGSLSDAYGKMENVLRQLGRNVGCAPLWGTGKCVDPLDAALCNGIASHAFELDDTGGCDHSGAVVLPAAAACLSLCGERASGKDFITAVVLGYDIARRALEACGAYEAHNEAGWHSTSTCGTFGAAAAAGYLLHLTEGEMQSALGLAASASGGLWAFIHDGAQSKRLHPGRAAEGGVLAALLAKQGFRGPQMVFEDVWGGFSKTFAAGSEDPGAWTRELGVNWKMGRVSIKPYTSCRSTHAAIDAARLLAERHQLCTAKIREVVVTLNAFVNGMCGGRDTTLLSGAQMSLPYGVAAMLVYGSAGLDAYTKCRRSASGVHAMLRNVRLVVDESMASDEEPVVKIVMKNGESYQMQVKIPLGSPANPMSDAALLEKYRVIAKMVWPHETAEKLANLSLSMERIPDMKAVVDILAAKPLGHEVIC